MKNVGGERLLESQGPFNINKTKTRYVIVHRTHIMQVNGKSLKRPQQLVLVKPSALSKVVFDLPTGLACLGTNKPARSITPMRKSWVPTDNVVHKDGLYLAITNNGPCNSPITIIFARMSEGVSQNFLASDNTWHIDWQHCWWIRVEII